MGMVGFWLVRVSAGISQIHGIAVAFDVLFLDLKNERE